MNQFEQGLVIAVLAAIIGGCCAIAGSWMQTRNSIKLSKLEETIIVKGVRNALKQELSTLWDRYMDTVGEHVSTLKDHNFIDIFWYISLDYFSVYHANSLYIGRIPDDSLRDSIVRTYTNAKGYVDSWKLHNFILEKLGNAITQKALVQSNLIVEPNNKNAKSLEAFWSGQEEYYRKTLIVYSQKINSQHITLKTQIASLIKAL